MNLEIETADPTVGAPSHSSPREATILATALGAQKVGINQWQARCPYHDDRTASLSIGVGRDGQALVHCHAGCESIFQRLRDDGHLANPTPAPPRAEPEARYDYHDAAGELLFTIARLPGKQFRGERVGEDGRTVYNVPSELRVPYRLPALVAADRSVLVFIGEGEKDADTLARHGYVATTNPFGAKKWKPHYNQYFAGRHVIVVPDNDEPGRQHAELVKHQVAPVAKSLRVLSLQGHVAEHGDVSDLVATRGIAAFEQLVRALPAASVRDRGYLHLDELAALGGMEWLVDGLLPKRGSVLLYGDSGVGKTFVAVDFGVRVAAGGNVFGRASTPGLVFYVALEGHAGLANRVRAAASEIGVQEVDALRFVVRHKPLDLRNPDSVANLIAAVNQASNHLNAPVALVIIDTLARAMPGADENGPADMATATAALDRVQHECSCAVLIIHHSGKTAERGARGHSSLRAAVDTELRVANEKSGKVLIVTKQREGSDNIKLPVTLISKVISAGAHLEGTVSVPVVRPTEHLEIAGNASPVGKSARRTYDALKEVLRRGGSEITEEASEVTGVPAGQVVATKNDWLAACTKAGISTGGAASIRRALNRSLKELIEAGLVEQQGEFCWLANPS